MSRDIKIGKIAWKVAKLMEAEGLTVGEAIRVLLRCRIDIVSDYPPLQLPDQIPDDGDED